MSIKHPGVTKIIQDSVHLRVCNGSLALLRLSDYLNCSRGPMEERGRFVNAAS